jgi:hypothetical protein
VSGVSLAEVATVFRKLDGVSRAVCLPIDVSGRLGIAAFVEGRPRADDGIWLSDFLGTLKLFAQAA